MGPDKATYCSEECRIVHESIDVRLGILTNMVSDHAQRFDTLQTPWWKRVLFFVNGWPWYNLNADRPSPRPWHRWWKP